MVGGVGLYIQSYLKFKLRTDLQYSDNAQYFNKSLDGVLSTISFENKLFFLMGDFNISILNSQSHQPSNEFISLMISNSLYPLISKPTRITSSTATLIEHSMHSGIL